MSPEQFEKFLADNRQSTSEAIEKTVNGKINRLTTLVTEGLEKQDSKMAKHINDHALMDSRIEGFIERSDPYISSWESAIKTGDNLKWLALFIASIGGAYLVLKNGLINLVNQ